MLLIHPILTYAPPIWWNTSAAQIEKIRMFERACLRTATNKYRSAETNYNRWRSNKKLYNEANITRIDNHILKTTRDYYSNCKLSKNNIIKNYTTINADVMTDAAKQGYPTPQTFILLDKKGVIQDDQNIPIIYHWKRHKKDKKIPTSWNEMTRRANPFKFSTAIPDRDLMDNHRLNPKYWWLRGGEAQHILKLKERLKKK